MAGFFYDWGEQSHWVSFLGVSCVGSQDLLFAGCKFVIESLAQVRFSVIPRCCEEDVTENAF